MEIIVFPVRAHLMLLMSMAAAMFPSQTRSRTLLFQYSARVCNIHKHMRTVGLSAHFTLGDFLIIRLQCAA